MTIIEKSQLYVVLSKYRNNRTTYLLWCVLFLLFALIVMQLTLLGFIEACSSAWNTGCLIGCGGFLFSFYHFYLELERFETYKNRIENYYNKGTSFDDAYKSLFEENK